jgi:hypothetical protein
VCLERSPLSLVSTIEELLGRNSSGSGLENREYGREDPLRWPRDTLYQQKLALTSSTCGGRSVGIVRLRTKTTEFFLIHCELFIEEFHRWFTFPTKAIFTSRMLHSVTSRFFSRKRDWKALFSWRSVLDLFTAPLKRNCEETESLVSSRDTHA